MILVTGATGTIGSELVRLLVDRGEPVRALVRDPARAASVLPDRVQLFRGDLTDPASIDEAVLGSSKLFLLGPPDERLVELEANVIDAARRACCVEHVVKLSAIHADPASPARFCAWHGQSEQHVRDANLPHTFLRPNFFMQNTLGLAAGIREHGTIYQPSGGARGSYVDARDVAAVAAAALTRRGHAGQTYTLTGPEALSYADIAAILSRVAGKPVRFVDVPRDTAKPALVSTGMPEWLAEGVLELMDLMRAGKMDAVTDDVERVTGAKPRTYEQFARDHAAVFRGR
jgi:uncharacterized protein YbjT (DUF2867 family)